MNNKSETNFDELLASNTHFTRFKELIRLKCDELKQKFDPQKPVTHLLHEKSEFMDRLLTACWRHFLGSQSQKFCLVAVGGYGRKEIFPSSDIDLLILLDDEPPSEHQERLSDFSRFLWDIGLKPGQSVRTVEECTLAAKEDQTIMTTLLESRIIDGNQALFNTMKTQTMSDNIWPSAAFFDVKMEEQKIRYTKYHDTAYNLEPNVKEGPGGLRDMQVIAWIFKHQVTFLQYLLLITEAMISKELL